MGDGRSDFGEDAQIVARFRRGGMAEWSKAVVLKATGDRLSQDGYFAHLIELQIRKIWPESARADRPRRAPR